MARTVRVYRLNVTYPPRSHWSQPDYDYRWTPEAWKAERDRLIAEIEDWEKNGDGDPFGGPRPLPAEYEDWRGWPVIRTYLCKKNAYRRADLLRSYGATVVVEASDPVSWPTPEGE